MQDEYIRLKERVRERLPGEDFVLSYGSECGERRKVLLRAAREVAWEQGMVIDPAEMQQMLERLLDDILGLGPLESLGMPDRPEVAAEAVFRTRSN